MLFEIAEDRYVNTNQIVKVTINDEHTVRITTVARDDTFPIIVAYDNRADALNLIEELKSHMK